MVEEKDAELSWWEWFIVILLFPILVVSLWQTTKYFVEHRDSVKFCETNNRINEVEARLEAKIDNINNTNTFSFFVYDPNQENCF